MSESKHASPVPGRPLPLVVARGSAEDAAGGGGPGMFTVGEEAVAALRKFDGPVAVVAVVGLYRTGKSYLVNRVVGQQHGFTVGPTVNACTKGIWMWSEPIPFENARGETMQMLVLDTEGIGGTKSSSEYDTRIFSLAVLLCSTLIYNSLGSIDESAVSNLSFVANLSQHVQVKANQNSNDGGDGDGGGGGDDNSTDALASFFPSFLWVIRDFALELVDDDYNDITEQDYLENCLRQQDGFSKDVMDKNRVRKSLTNFFQRRDCATIVRPIDDEALLQQLDDQPYESLRPLFREQLERMRSRLLAQLTAKTLRGKAMSGAMLGTLVRTYVDAMNTNGVPTITTAWDHVAATETKASLKRALEGYTAGLEAAVGGAGRDKLPVDEAALAAAHKELKRAAKAEFLAGAVGDQAGGSHMEKLKTTVAGLFEDAQQANMDASQDSCAKLFARLHAAQIESRLPGASAGEGGEGGARVDHLADIDSVRVAFGRLQDDYLAQATGPARNAVLNDMLVRKHGEADAAVNAFIQEQKEAEMRSVLARAREAEQRLAQVEGSEAALREELSRNAAEQGAGEAEAMQLAVQLKGQQQEAEMLRKRAQDAETKLQDEARKAAAAQSKHEMDLEKQLEEIKLTLQQREEENQALQMAQGKGGCGCVVS